MVLTVEMAIDYIARKNSEMGQTALERGRDYLNNPGTSTLFGEEIKREVPTLVASAFAQAMAHARLAEDRNLVRRIQYSMRDLPWEIRDGYYDEEDNWFGGVDDSADNLIARAGKFPVLSNHTEYSKRPMHEELGRLYRDGVRNRTEDGKFAQGYEVEPDLVLAMAHYKLAGNQRGIESVAAKKGYESLPDESDYEYAKEEALERIGQNIKVNMAKARRRARLARKTA